VRGSSFVDYLPDVRCAFRPHLDSSHINYNVGFRVVRHETTSEN